MTELERQLSEALVSLSRKYEADMKRLEAHNEQLTRQLSELARQWKTDGDARDRFAMERIDGLAKQVKGLSEQVERCVKTLDEVSRL